MQSWFLAESHRPAGVGFNLRDCEKLVVEVVGEENLPSLTKLVGNLVKSQCQSPRLWRRMFTNPTATPASRAPVHFLLVKPLPVQIIVDSGATLSLYRSISTSLDVLVASEGDRFGLLKISELCNIGCTPASCLIIWVRSARCNRFACTLASFREIRKCQKMITQ